MKLSLSLAALTLLQSTGVVSAFAGNNPISSFVPKVPSTKIPLASSTQDEVTNGGVKKEEVLSAESLEYKPGTVPTIVSDQADVPPATPAFTRSSYDGIAPSSTRLPLGIKLHGGEKLREEGLTGKGVKVAVIDSGVAAGHPGFGDQVVEQVWYRRGTPLMSDDHGTHVAGTITMMAPEAEIYDYRVFGRYGVDINEAINSAIDEAIEEGCDVINMSLGGPFPDWQMRRVMRKAYRAGVIMVVAAGNEGDNNVLTNENSYPANFRDAISIGAVAKKDNLPMARFTNTNSAVDYCGIGVDVVSFRPNGTYHQMSGTSMATPHVCGLICALMTKDGKYADSITDDASCRAFLNEKCLIDVAAEGKDNATGLGFVTYLTKDEFEKDFLDLPEF